MEAAKSGLAGRESRDGATETEATETARPLPDAARRALAEAAERRARAAGPSQRELNGRGGHDPARYGDWEVKGIASDF